MCGIAGYFEPGSREEPAAGGIEAMTRSLSHRGPDDEGYWRAPGVALGHRRLSIIDLSPAGHQPMHDGSGRYTIVFNGEIYNYRALKEELVRMGRRFTSGSDTEVILEAYAVWGDACVERLRGMFAFALWDAPRRRLFLARDRVGIKPLYYAWDGRRIHFGSEIKAILADPSVPRDLDLRALDEYLSFLYVPAPRSIFAAVRKLRAGHTLAISAEGLEEREYWDLRFEPDSIADARATARDLLGVLEDSVRVHLESDVPVGAFLSGGLDSSAVVALMARMVKEPVRTASIGFEESDFNELPYARVVAKACGTKAYEKTVRASAAAILDRLTWHYDEPFADSSAVPTYYVSAVAREQVKVCLSGDGGDENFAGYRRYRFDYLENRIRAGMPAWLRATVLGPVSAAYPKLDWAPRSLRGKTLLSNLARSPERAYFHTMTWYHPEMKRELYLPWLEEAIKGHDAFSAMEPHFRRSEGWHPLSRIQYVDVKTYLVDDILTKVDRASMAHSLEVRVPVIDHLVMERAARIPADLKLRGGTGKYVFKEAMAPLLAPEIIHRPKMGFSVPLAAWLRGELRGPFEGSVLAPESFVSRYFRADTIRRWWDAHQRGTSNHSHRLWMLLVLEHWGRRFATG
jgi:asparagine synthase (glutamine-hydrolysing)